MRYGSVGNIAFVDLTKGTVELEHPDDLFFRQYLGGGMLGAYYLLSRMPPAIDAFSPQNMIVFAAGIGSGVPVSGLSRFCVTSKSPLGGAIAESQAGGSWGAELKFAGFDALVVTGSSPTPVFIWAHDGEIEIKDASPIWGLDAQSAEQWIRNSLTDNRIRVAGIGQGGEHCVRFACVVNDGKHFNGRGGMGAVMGSKKLKAIAVRGHSTIPVHDRKAIAEFARMAVKLTPDNSTVQLLSEMGTNAWMTGMNEEGGLPTRNFAMADFAGADRISARGFEDLGLDIDTASCFACVVHCKQVVSSDPRGNLPARSGMPEYESAAALGAYIEVDDPRVVLEANRLCARYTLDTIATGAAIAFAMDCYEAGLLSKAQTDGLELRFGNAEVVLPLIEKIARREGIGNLLAEGTWRAGQILGGGAIDYAMQVKGIDIPAHLPQGKQSLALAFSTLPTGADHSASEHDYLIAPSASPLAQERAHALGLQDRAELWDLNEAKVRLYTVTHKYRSFIEALCMCHYCFALSYLYSPDQLVSLVNAITGWQVDLLQLMTAGERRISMQRAFNAREGFDASNDRLPPRFHEPLGGRGPNAGRMINPGRLAWAREEYYTAMGWDPKSGNPTRAKLEELGISWVAEEFERWGKIPPS